MTLTQIAPTFWGSYGASMVALLGFLLNGFLMYGAAQKLAGQREELLIQAELQALRNRAGDFSKSK